MRGALAIEVDGRSEPLGGEIRGYSTHKPGCWMSVVSVAVRDIGTLEAMVLMLQRKPKGPRKENQREGMSNQDSQQKFIRQHNLASMCSRISADGKYATVDRGQEAKARDKSLASVFTMVILADVTAGQHDSISRTTEHLLTLVAYFRDAGKAMLQN